MMGFAQNSIVDSLQLLLPDTEGIEKVDLLLEIANAYGSNEMDKKTESIQAALTIAKEIEYELGIAKSLFTYGNAYHQQREYYKAMDYYLEAESVLRNLNEPHLLGLTYLNHGVAYDDMRNRDSAYMYHVKAVEQLEQTDDLEELSNAITKIGLEYWRWTEYTEALKYHQKALELRKQTGKANLVAKSLNNMGVIYYRLGKYDFALDFYMQAHDIHDSLGNAQNLVHITNNIGLIYLERDNYSEAENNFHEGLRIARKNEHLSGITYSLQNISKSYEKQNKLDSALTFCTDALKLIENNELNQYTKVQLKIASGRLNQKLGNPTKAIEYFQDALEISKSMPYIIGEAEAKRNLGLLYISLNNFSRAENYLLEALELVQGADLRPHIRDYLKDLHKLYMQKGNYKTALDYHQKYTALKDSIEYDATNEKTAYLLVQFETERKELENVRLRAEIERETIFRNSAIIITVLAFLLVGLIYSRFRIQRKAHTQTVEQKQKVEQLNNELNEANITKDKFFSIISHDLKSPFTSILGYSEILYDEFDKLPRETITEAIKNINISAKNSYELLENLLNWARTQRGVIKSVPEVFKVKKMTNQSLYLTKQLANDKGIRIETFVDEKLEVFSDKEMYNTILRNLVSNAIKFTEPGGTITIRAIEKDNAIEFAIQDTGTGIAEEDKKHLFQLETEVTRTGTHDEKGTGLGLILCKEFVERQNGKIWFESEIGKGSTFFFTLPKAVYA